MDQASDGLGDVSAGAGNPGGSRILTVNGGSSSLKFALFDRTEPAARRGSGRIDRIGGDSRWIASMDGRVEDRPVDAPDLKAAAGLLIEWLERAVGFTEIAAVGHRVVHGGSRREPEPITAELIEELRGLSDRDPDHMPGEIALVEALRDHAPDLPQVACFDTAFHHDMPRPARIVAIPRRYEAAGVKRYGFHGISYTYLIEELARIAPAEARGRVVLAHLGSGASLAAVLGGRSIDTTMGFTPASGLVMGTRSGDLDPGLVRFLARTEGMTADRFDAVVNHESGLLGVSETSSDVRDLLARRTVDVRAAEAIDVFCYQAKKGIGGFAAALGGLDALVFSGGVGENAPEIRGRICAGLDFLGISLDQGRNEANAPVISTDQGMVKVRIVRTDEESIIARAAARLVQRPA